MLELLFENFYCEVIFSIKTEIFILIFFKEIF